MSDTMLDRLGARVGEALEYNANALAPPVALLWPDEGRQWEPIVGRLRERLRVVSLGEYAPEHAQGPAYWVRCVVAGAVAVELPDGCPIVYLPGVARGDLRAIESCPSQLAPISELQYRSQWFSHPNGKDWTVRSLLANAERGLGFNVGDDAETASMLLLALDRLVDVPLSRLSNRLLDAEFFGELINPDPIRSLLDWLDDPATFERQREPAEWSAFVQRCQTDYGVNAASAGVITAAERFGSREGAWAHVWKRFAEAPERYPGIPDRLRLAKPAVLSFEPDEAWPQDNEAAEDQLRNVLVDFTVLTAEGARKEFARLDVEHKWRRSTVWAQLGRAPLALALEQLTRLAELTSQPLAGDDVGSLAANYAERGWRADDALLRALGAVRTNADRSAVEAAANVVYRPWLEAGALTLQDVVGPMANSGTYQAAVAPQPAAGTVAVFVDGLRLDVGHRVSERLTDAGLDARVDVARAALPTVTQTAKAAIMPVTPGALGPGPDLHAAKTSTGTKATTEVLRSLVADNTVQVLKTGDVGDASGSAWTEAGEFDHRGHDAGIRLVDYLDEDIQRLVARIRELLDAGWQRVEIVTDHGWILLPGAMDKAELPVATTDTKKGRCARLKDGAEVSTPTVPWFWDRDVRIALAPGVSCFEANKEYEHGGVSPQECFVPRIVVTAGTAATATGGPEITRVTWLGLLCRVEFTRFGSGVTVDLRALPADAKTSIAEEAKETIGAGKVSLLVPDEELEGQVAYLVVVGPDGQIVMQREVTVGRNR